MPKMNAEQRAKKIKWNAYLLYLKDWIAASRELESYGSSPACFDDWESYELSGDKENDK